MTASKAGSSGVRQNETQGRTEDRPADPDGGRAAEVCRQRIDRDERLVVQARIGSDRQSRILTARRVRRSARVVMPGPLDQRPGQPCQIPGQRSPGTTRAYGPEIRVQVSSQWHLRRCVDAWHVAVAWNRHHVDVVIAVPVFGVHDIVEIQEPAMEPDSRCDRSARRQSETSDEQVLDGGMGEVEVVVPHDEVELAAGRHELAESPENLGLTVRDQSEPLDAFANGPLRSHARLESRQVEHVAQDDKAHPRAGVAKLAGQVLDETGECERRIVLVGWTSVPRQMEIADEDKDLVARLSYVRVPSGTNCLSLI
jgi:hypothetical protein